MSYAKQTWVDGETGATPLSATRLNYMETGIETAASGLLTAATAASKPLVVKGAASQTANLAEFQDSAGAVLTVIAASGAVQSVGVQANQFGPTRDANAALTASAHAATWKGLVVRGADSQTANLAEFQNSAGTVVASVSSIGGLTSTHIMALGIAPPNNGTLRVGSVLASQVGVAVRGAVSQTSNLAEFQNSAGTALARITPGGSIISAEQLGVNDATSPATVRLIIRGAASQTANLAEFQNSAGSILAGIESDGTSILGGNTETTGQTGGSAQTLPSNPVGYIRVKIAGTARKIPFYG